jgi:hypothetical protein
MREIPVWKSTRRGGRGHHTLILIAHAQVDDDDYPLLSRFTWLAKRSSHGRTLYASRSVSVNGRKTDVFMHREVMGLGPLAEDPREVDHRDGNGLHNTRSNLRIVDHGTNMMNVSLRRDSKTGLKGVTRHAATGKYQAMIQRDRQKIYLGLHVDACTAAVVYNAAARLLFGEHGCFNTIPADKLPSPTRQAELEAQVERTVRSYRVARTPPAAVTATR